tara:strand:- start:1 stop:438 length:438 start_codon:yes stop_codon:yes gene_type:complete
MGSARRTPPRIVNTPTGPRERTRMAGESMERAQRRVGAAFSPRKRKELFTRDRRDQIRDKDMEARKAERMERREERKQTFGDSFREQRKERRESRRERDDNSEMNRRIFRRIRTREKFKEALRQPFDAGNPTPPNSDPNIAKKDI